MKEISELKRQYRLYEKELTNNQHVLSVIYKGNQFQFEDFYKYVDNDMLSYIKKIKNRIEELKYKNEE